MSVMSVSVSSFSSFLQQFLLSFIYISYLCQQQTYISSPMTNKNRILLNQIKAVARDSAPKGSQVLLFGSRARGEAQKDSDWDILIVLPKNKLEQSDYDEVSFPFVELGWRVNQRINPIMYTQGEWKANSITPFYDNVIRDGISLI